MKFIRSVFETANSNCDLVFHLFFYKQTVCKKLALAWQIPMQLSGFKPLSLSKNKNYRSKKKGVFPF